MKQPFKPRLTVNEYANGILQGDRVVLSRAITLMESSLKDDQHVATALIEKIIGNTGKSMRIGITGSPGVGKSTFIEIFGKCIINSNKKVAILTIDPSSSITQGSILGDKTRMEDLSKNPKAFIRPTASGHRLGGVAGKTREAILLCEAAGYEIIIIETVGVGQSEVEVKNMSDFFLLLMLAGSGDELQGMKKGIMEMADAIVITKADGDNITSVTKTEAEFKQALHLLPSQTIGWQPEVLTCSAKTGMGIEEIWNMILKYKSQTETSGYFMANRHKQNIAWLHHYFDELLRNDFQEFNKSNNGLKQLEDSVGHQNISVQEAAHKLLALYHASIRESK